MYDLAVIGAGPGGYEAAVYAGRMGKKVALFEKQHIGGTCLNAGCIPTKTLLKASHVLNACKEADWYGVETQNAILNLKTVQKRKQKVIADITRSMDYMLKLSNVEVINAHASITSKRSIFAAGKEYKTEHILISTGSKPAHPSIKGIDDSHILDSTGLLAIQSKPESMIIIGGGSIGLEFACFFAEIGTKVTVLEMLPAIGGELDEEIVNALTIELKKKQITFHLSSTVTEIMGQCVHFTDSEKICMQVEADAIVNATGRRPAFDEVGLEKVGVDHTSAGIQTSAEGKTNIPGIWACGDVTGRCLLAHAATREGHVAVNNMFGKKDRMRYDTIPGVIYTHPEVAHVGKSEQQLKNSGVAYKKSVMPMSVSGRYILENIEKTGIVKLLTSIDTGEILGMHMIGHGCSELIFGAALMMDAKMPVEDIKAVIFPHPTVSEAIKTAVSFTT